MKKILAAILVTTLCALAASAQSAGAAGVPPERRMVIIDQDGSGPGGSNMMSMMALLQSPDVDVLGIGIVTGNAWRDDEVRHTLRMLELIGRSDVPVMPGAVFPLVRTQEETRLATPLVGQVGWLGAWGQRPDSISTQHEGLVEAAKPKAMPGPFDVPPLAEGEPRTRPIDEDAAHFLVRQVRAHPGKITIYAAGPLTDIALAIALDPHFAERTRGIVIMGSSLNPHTDDPEFDTNPRHEFNFWFDPEAAHMVLRAHWPRIDVTTVDISIQAMFTQEMVDAIAKSPNAAARYIANYSQERYYLWDEIAACAWLDPTIVKRERQLYMDVDISHGPSYGQTLTWSADVKPAIDLPIAHAQVDLDVVRFKKMFVELMSGPTISPARAR